jgi:hypothetical protein
MPTLAQRNFSSGEISPSLYARTDIIQYLTGLRSCHNFLIRKHGGAWNRPGTKYVCSTKSGSTKTSKLIPFIFNNDQTYMIEVGDLYMRFLRNGVPVTVSGVAAYAGGTAYVIGDLVSSGGINYYCIKAGTGQTPASSATYWYPLTGNIYEIPTPYVEADLPTLHYNQSADVITLTHPSYAVRELARSGHTNWTLTAVTFASSISAPTGLASSASGTAHYYVVTAIKEETLEESLPTDPVGSSSETSKLTWVASDGAKEYNIYKKKNGAYGFIGIATALEFTDSSISPDEADPAPTYRNPFAATPIKTTTLAAGGTGYSVGDILGITQTGASGGKMRVDTVNAGAVVTYTIIDPGTGYAVGNALATTGGAGSNCTINITAVTTGNFPSTSGYYQQRQGFANTNEDTEKAWFSRSANFKNFSISSPLQDDDAVTFPLRGRQVNSVKHMIDLGKLVVFTTGAEWIVNGDQAGILRAGEVNQVAQSYNGCSDLRPIIINDTALYVQARQNIVRDLKYQIGADGSDGYQGTDLTIMSGHLFEQYTLVDWAFAQTPNPIAWIVRSDGILLGLTYLREHKIFAWHRHTFQDGEVENVAVIPEGNEDALYLIIKRTINGATVRYIERFSSRRIDDIKDSIFMDSSLTYDGRNATAVTMALTSSGGWLYTDDLTLTASSAFFSAGDIGNEIHITGADGSVLRCQIVAYTSTTVVTVKPHKTVPTALRTGSTTNWAKAVDQVSGLSHIEGEDVSIFGDAFVVASPNNSAYTVKTVSSGVVTLDKCYSVIHVGLPYMSDLETLDIDNPQGETLADKKKLVTSVTVYVEATRGIWAGHKPPSDDDVDPLEDLYEHKGRNDELMSEPTDLKTGQVEINTKSEWNSNGRTFIRQVDPIPLSVLAIMPNVTAPFK